MNSSRIVAWLFLPAALLSIGLSVPAVAQDFTQGAQAQPNSGWGAGPLMIPLVEAARHEGPVKGLTPVAEAAKPVRAAMLALPSRAIAPAPSVTAQNEALASTRATVVAHADRKVVVASY